MLSEHAPADELVREVHLSMTGLILDDEGRIRVQNAVGDLQIRIFKLVLDIYKLARCLRSLLSNSPIELYE